MDNKVSYVENVGFKHVGDSNLITLKCFNDSVFSCYLHSFCFQSFWFVLTDL